MRAYRRSSACEALPIPPDAILAYRHGSVALAYVERGAEASAAYYARYAFRAAERALECDDPITCDACGRTMMPATTETGGRDEGVMLYVCRRGFGCMEGR